MPLVMPVILKCVTSAPSTGFRLMTNWLKPTGVMSSSLVDPFVTEGVSATGLTVSTNVPITLPPVLLTVTVIVVVPN